MKGTVHVRNLHDGILSWNSWGRNPQILEDVRQTDLTDSSTKGIRMGQPYHKFKTIFVGETEVPYEKAFN